jgi:tetratricopeptide (TPR) repeat protein
MKKRRPIKPHKDNIFLFPNVDKLLMEKGLEKLKNKKFKEAITLLEEAQELDLDNEEISLGLIIAYFESNNLQVAKQLAHKSLKKGLGDYFQLIDIYIMILLQLNEYEEIVSTVQALLDEREIPSEKLDNFSKILEFSKRKLDSQSKKMMDPPSFPEEKDMNLFQYDNINDQFLAIAKLSQKNVRGYLNEIRDYLKSSEGHPFLKSMLLQLLKEQDVNEEMVVEKFQQRHSINPIHLVDMDSYMEATDITAILKRVMEQENPTLYESMKEMVTRHSFLLFPIERQPSDPKMWAAAYHFMALEYFGMPNSIEKTALKYEVKPGNLNDAISFLRKLEEISSPII